jgi:hypothetical protein
MRSSSASAMAISFHPERRTRGALVLHARVPGALVTVRTYGDTSSALRARLQTLAIPSSSPERSDETRRYARTVLMNTCQA